MGADRDACDQITKDRWQSEARSDKATAERADERDHERNDELRVDHLAEASALGTVGVGEQFTLKFI
jgi:hypothetical protein